MTSSRCLSHTRRLRGPLALGCASSFTLAALCALPPHARAQEQKGAGITLGADADAKDVGLPLYPHSRRHVDNDSDSTGANFGLWGGGSGFKLAVLKMESDDPPEKIAKYYKKALAKYGNVLDCSNPSPSEASKDESSKALTCDSDKPDPGGMLLKSGTKEKQHIVGIKPNGSGTLFQLVYIAHWDSDEKK